ncbi:MAG TPA: FAD-dependent oxidoreductase [Flavipsychrobacter sp.]|nr:FAD-dependent oxidoreductase [Flavipsychrobacter sp.]
MRLRTFEAYFLLKNGLLYSYPMLRHSIETEIVVVGAGITGALISHALMEAGYKTVLVDKRDIGQGSTSATTAMLQYEIDVPLFKLSKMIGEENAARCYAEGIEAIRNLGKLVDQFQIDCGFKSKQSLYVAHHLTARRSLEKEFEIREKNKLGVQWMDAAAVAGSFGITSEGGILSDTAASTDAYRLAHELIHLNCQRGMQVYDQTQITGLEFDTNAVTIRTAGDNVIKAKKAIFCTGFETTQMLKEKIAKIFYTWACVSEEKIVLPGRLHDTLVWDTADPYFYMRSTADGRLLIGGEDSPYSSSVSKQVLKEKKSKLLVKKLQKMMPDVLFEEDFNWGGTFGSTKDGLPYIGASPEYESAYFVLGFGGNGITFSVQGMNIITDLLEGKENELAKLYRFGR